MTAGMSTGMGPICATPRNSINALSKAAYGTPTSSQTDPGERGLDYCRNDNT